MVGFQARDVIGPGGGGSSAGAACDRTGGRTFWDGRLWLLVVCVLAVIGLAIFASVQKRKNNASSGRG